jgi:hypothetical protein
VKCGTLSSAEFFDPTPLNRTNSDGFIELKEAEAVKKTAEEEK